MERRNFLGSLVVLPALADSRPLQPPPSDRTYWLQTLLRVAEPVLVAAAAGQLREQMPIETTPGQLPNRQQVSHLEALGRTLAGLAPWLEADVPAGERAQQQRFGELARQAIARTTDPTLPSFLNFTEHSQPLVDAAFLAHGLLRAPNALWNRLDHPTRQHLIAALLKFTGQADEMRLDYALKQHEQWYKGDGIYGDGPAFHWDYYNSYVIQPMLLDVVQTMQTAGKLDKSTLDTLLPRARRYAVVQERLIATDGTFAAFGRSLAYRCGAFQHLAQMALQRQLPDELPPNQVRSALTAVIRRTMDAPGTFDRNGWLQIGLCGHQPDLGERYISTGSLYLCSVAFLPLGLPDTDPFWSAPATDWTARQVWSGKNVKPDHAL